MTTASDELRDQVWKALVKFQGDRIQAAKELGVSPRTLNRYIRVLNLYADMDKARMMRNQGPPRGPKQAITPLQQKIFDHIERNNGDVDYPKLIFEAYGLPPNNKLRQRLYSTMNDMKGKMLIAQDDKKWWILRRTK